MTKKLTALLLALGMCLSLFACGKKYERNLDSFIPDDRIRLGMNREEIKELYPDCKEEGTILIDDSHIFRFTDGGLSSVVFGASESELDTLAESLGKPDKSSKRGFRFWYGTLFGTECYLGISEDGAFGPEFEFAIE